MNVENLCISMTDTHMQTHNQKLILEIFTFRPMFSARNFLRAG